MHKKIIYLSLFLFLVNSVNSLPAPTNLTFTDYSTNDFDVIVCDIKTDNCNRYLSNYSIQLQTDRDYFIRVVPPEREVFNYIYGSITVDNIVSIMWLAILLIVIGTIFFWR